MRTNRKGIADYDHPTDQCRTLSSHRQSIRCSPGFMNNPLTGKPVPDPPSFDDVLQTRTQNVVVRDTQLEERGRQARAQLRSIPFFKELGIDTVVHSDVYDNDFKLIDYDYQPTLDLEGNIGEIEFPLVHITTQEAITDYGEEDVVQGLLERSIEEDGRYVLVTDSTAPRLPNYIRKPGRSIVDDYDVSVKDYEILTDRYLREYLNSALPASKTRNIHYHRASEHHRQRDAPADTLEGIYDYTRAPSESPVWEPLYYFVEHDLENILEEYSERIREALRSWTESGETQRIANSMLDALRVCEFGREQLEDYQQTPPELR